MSALSLDDDADDLDRSRAVIASVAASSSVAAPGDPDRQRLVTSVAADLEALALSTGWDQVEVARLIGCSTPSVEVWRNAPLDVLERSERVVHLLLRQVEAVARPGGRDDRGGPREVLYLTLEALVRCGGVVDAADLVLAHVVEGASTLPPIELVRADRLGAARTLVLRRVAAWFGPVTLDEPDADPDRGDRPGRLDEDEEANLRLLPAGHLDQWVGALRDRVR